MEMRKNRAIALLAAMAAVIGTAPVQASPDVKPASSVMHDAASGNAELQRGSRGGGQRAAGHQGTRQAAARPARQANVPHNVRSTSGNNLNAAHNRGANANRNVNRNTNVNRNYNRDVNVDVDYHGGWDNDWDDHYHPIAAGVAMGATAAIVGSIVSHPPTTGCVTQIVNGISYTQCGSTWYQPQYAGTTVQYIVVNPPM